MKKFLISIDTEGDNLWSWKEGMPITSENSKYLQRFQSLCDSYGFKPTYLTNYEMASSRDFLDFAKQTLRNNRCEIGMHLHAWNNPPEFQLSNVAENGGAAYLIEYPLDVMEEKISYITEYLANAFETPITSHRAGRWAMNNEYFSLLEKYNYTVDCSVTPYINWSDNIGASKESKGSDYSNHPIQPYIVPCTKGLIEVPVSIRRTNKWFLSANNSIKGNVKAIYSGLRGQEIWLRPNGKNLKKMLWMVQKIAGECQSDYIMFMLHSSEFMPGGSPTFRTHEDIDVLYEHLDITFKAASKYFEGETISNYANHIKEELKK